MKSRAAASRTRAETFRCGTSTEADDFVSSAGKLQFQPLSLSAVCPPPPLLSSAFLPLLSTLVNRRLAAADEGFSGWKTHPVYPNNRPTRAAKTVVTSWCFKVFVSTVQSVTSSLQLTITEMNNKTTIKKSLAISHKNI